MYLRDSSCLSQCEFTKDVVQCGAMLSFAQKTGKVWQKLPQLFAL